MERCVSCFNERFVFQMGGFIFKWGGGWVPLGGISFGGRGGFEKNCMGKPEKNHLIIKNNSSILKKQ